MSAPSRATGEPAAAPDPAPAVAHVIAYSWGGRALRLECEHCIDYEDLPLAATQELVTARLRAFELEHEGCLARPEKGPA